MILKSLQVGLQPNGPDCCDDAPHYVAVVMGYDTEAKEPQWYNTGVVAHGKTPTEAFEKALAMSSYKEAFSHVVPLKQATNDDVVAHGISLNKYTLKDLEKEVKLMGSVCEFTSEEQAKNFVSRYAANWGSYSESYEGKLEWKGPGRYHFTGTHEMGGPMYEDQGPQNFELRFFKLFGY